MGDGNAAIATVIVTIPIFEKLGSEFMPPLFEGSLLYMPMALPGISVTEAQKLLQVQDKISEEFSRSGSWFLARQAGLRQQQIRPPSP